MLEASAPSMASIAMVVLAGGVAALWVREYGF